MPRLSVAAIVLGSVLALAAVAGGAWYIGHHGRPAAEPAKAEGANYWTCGMHPEVILPAPGQCPICHMDLVPLEAGTAQQDGTVTIDPAIAQSIGVRTAKVKVGPVTRTIRTVGRIEYDESAVRVINTKVAGWVEKLHVDKTGQLLEKGQPLFDLYSPELYTAQQDYLIAMRQRDAASSPQQKQAAQELMDGIRKRMQYFDIGDAQVQALEKAGQATKAMTIASPYRGIVTEKHITEGSKLEAGAELFHVADLSKVWAIVTLYEYQLPFVSVNQPAVMTLSYIPGQEFKGKVAYVYPFLNEEVRQARVRVEFDNPNGLLKPGMYANVELRSTLADNRLLVPREAIINTGTRQVALVSLAAGKFQPREVRVGVEAQDGMVEILDGLRENENVVTSGQFLLDSESRLREALAKMVSTSAGPGNGTTQPAAVKEIPPELHAQLAKALKSYDAISDLIFHEKVEGLDKPAREIAAAVDTMLKVRVPGQDAFWDDHHEAADIRAKALELIEARDARAARPIYQDLGIAMGKLLRAVGVPPQHEGDVFEYVCGMYKEGQGGGVWLQGGGEVRNPFFGAAMPTCFSKKDKLPKAGAAQTQPAQTPAMPPGHQH